MSGYSQRELRLEQKLHSATYSATSTKISPESEANYIYSLIAVQRKTRWNAFDQDCYILPADWFAHWAEFIRQAGKENPGPINTANLLMDSKEYYHNYGCYAAPCNYVIKETLEESKDYYVVSRDIWKFLANTYGGGGTALRRYNVPAGPNGKLKRDVRLKKVR